MEDQVIDKEVEAEEDDVNADVAAAIAELSGETEAKEPETAPTEVVEEPEVVAEPAKEVPPPPQSWTNEEKAAWQDMSPAARSAVLRRDNDIESAFTRHDGELRLGREIKDIVAPYMPLIQASNSTPAATINNLLNTAYKLNTGDEQTRLAIVKQIAKDYRVNLEGLTSDEEYVDPTIANLQREIAQLRELANPQAIESRLTQRLENDRINADINAFASNPENIHFETARPLMVALLQTGQAPGLKEAYDMACMANPQIRSTLEAAKTAELEAKRKQEYQAKKRAASSVAGSPANISNSSAASNPKSSVEDDIRAALSELESRI